MKRHPTDLHLEAFLLDQSDEGRKILFHLCECERCRERFRSRTPRHPASLPGPDSEPPPPLPGNPRVLGFAGVLELLIERSLATATRDAEEAEVLAALAGAYPASPFRPFRGPDAPNRICFL